MDQSDRLIIRSARFFATPEQGFVFDGLAVRRNYVESGHDGQWRPCGSLDTHWMTLNSDADESLFTLEGDLSFAIGDQLELATARYPLRDPLLKLARVDGAYYAGLYDGGQHIASIEADGRWLAPALEVTGTRLYVLSPSFGSLLPATSLQPGRRSRLSPLAARSLGSA